MDFDQLETFLEVARLSSFSRAAEKRFRTQPAVSAQIRALEEEAGARLLDRSGGKVALTAAGKVFQAFAEDVIDSRRRTLIAVAEMERVPRGEIVVGANEATCLYILPDVFAEFKAKHAEVGVSVSRAERSRTLDAVIDGSVDFGIISMPVSDKRLTVVQIHRDELVVIAPPEHPLATCGRVTPDQLASYPLLLPKAGRTREAIEKLFSDRHLTPAISMELDSSELLKRFVAAGVGAGFMAESFVKREVAEGLLASLRIAGGPIRRDLALVFRKDKALSRAALAFIDIAVKLKNVPAASVTP
jgi:DNA-binding transcriptional LysR family regulator